MARLVLAGARLFDGSGSAPEPADLGDRVEQVWKAGVRVV